MKKIIILLLFVFIALFATSCMVGLARDGNGNYRDSNGNYTNYRNSSAQYNDNNGNYRHRGRNFRSREERHHRHSGEYREEQPVLIIR